MKSADKFFPEQGKIVLSEKDMILLGHHLADLLEPGDILGFVGDLGAGKTCLIRGILEGLASPNPAASPTFSLVLEHPAARIPVAHFDFYRFRSPEEAASIGWEDYLDASPRMVLLVEWADRFDGSLMPPDTTWLTISRNPSSPSSRLVRLLPSPGQAH